MVVLVNQDDDLLVTLVRGGEAFYERLEKNRCGREMKNSVPFFPFASLQSMSVLSTYAYPPLRMLSKSCMPIG